MKKIVMMIDMHGWGGVTHYTYNLMQALADSGMYDYVLVTDSSYELASFPARFRIIRSMFRELPYFGVVVSLAHEILKHQPRIIHVQSGLSARKDWFPFLLLKLFGMRLVLTAHNVLPHEEAEGKAFFMRMALRIMYSCADAIIVHSRFSRDTLSRMFRVDNAKIKVVPHGNYSFFRSREMSRADACASLGLDAGRKIILQFGALREYKGIDMLLDAFAKAKVKNPAVFLVIAGKPINLDVESVKKKICDYGLQKDVFLKAEYIPFEQIPAYFFASDVAVFPYKEIDMSGSLQVAYAFGKPVVCTRSGGLPEAVRNGENGIVVDTNSDALHKGLLSIVDDAQRLRMMGEASARMAREDFSWDAIASSTNKIYQDLFIRIHA